MDAAYQSLSQCVTVSLFLEDERTDKLRLQLLQMVIPIVSQLISDANDHELQLVNLADGFRDLGWCSLLLYLVAGLDLSGDSVV